MNTKPLLYSMQLSSELSSMIQCILCCWLLRIIITREIDRDGEIRRERMKAIPPEGFLSFFAPLIIKDLWPLCAYFAARECANMAAHQLLWSQAGPPTISRH